MQNMQLFGKQVGIKRTNKTGEFTRFHSHNSSYLDVVIEELPLELQSEIMSEDYSEVIYPMDECISE